MFLNGTRIMQRAVLILNGYYFFALVIHGYLVVLIPIEFRIQNMGALFYCQCASLGRSAQTRFYTCHFGNNGDVTIDSIRSSRTR